MEHPTGGGRRIARFLGDVEASLSVHRYRNPVAVWPQDGESVAEAVLAALDGGPGDDLAELVAGLAGRLGGNVSVTTPRLPASVIAFGEVLILGLCGSCGVTVGTGLRLRLRAGELVYVPSGRAYDCADMRGECLVLVLHLAGGKPERR
jgi:hypothetical protein